MTHWEIIAVAYGLSFAAVAAEIALLWRRRRAALRQAQAWDRAGEPGPGGEPLDPAEPRSDREAGEPA
jgi:heme exporter protein CcmD